MNVLKAILTAYKIKDEGVSNLNQISITDLQTVYEEMVIPNPGEPGLIRLKTIVRTRLKHLYKLCDIVHRVFLL